MKKLFQVAGLALLVAACVTKTNAGKPVGNGPPSGAAFQFTYNIGGEVTNYHVYNMACQVGVIAPQPAGTIILGFWYVYDLGPATGTATISCNPVLQPRHSHNDEEGFLFFGDARDVGGDGSTANFTHPFVMVSKDVATGIGNIQVADPTAYVFNGAVPFSWSYDISPYVSN